MLDEFKKTAEEKMDEVTLLFEEELKSVRSGRASSALLDKIHVDCYGSSTPLKQLSTISVPEARLLVIQPFDKNLLKDIEKAILASDLSVSPNNDGKVIRISLPPLTEERRKELVKETKKHAEEAKVKIRNIRREINDKLKKSDLSEDLRKQGTDEIQTLTDKHTEVVSKIFHEKEKEIMEV